MEQREGELVYLKLDMDGADGKALSSQGILAGTEYEYYKPFDDAPEYEEYKEVPKWLKVVAGVAVAAVVGLAVGALVVVTVGLAVAALGVTAVQLGMTAGVLTAGAGIAAVAATVASDKKNGTESSLGDYISNAFWASARVGAEALRRKYHAVLYCEADDLAGDKMYPLSEADHGYAEGQTVTVDELQFTAWHTPGHTPGSVVLLCGEYLFCGDTLFAGSIGRTDLEGGSSDAMNASLRKLAKLPIPRETQVLPGHGEFSTFGEERDNNYFIRSALRGGEL